MLPSFNENVSLVLHYNQALLDLLDDWQDIQEDVQEDMPNVFVMASLEVFPYSKIKNSNHLMVRNIILDALDFIKCICHWISERVSGIS